MKKHLLVVFWFALSTILVSVYSQTYTLSVTSEEFQFLDGGQSAIDETWDDPQLTLPIGFSFDYFATTIQEIYLSSGFNNITLTNSPAGNILSIFVLFGADLIDRGYADNLHQSPITYQVTGNPGSRIFTAEWKNAGFYGDLTFNGSSTDYVNFQLKLYESNGDIVFHFGPNSVTMPEFAYSGTNGPVIGLVEDYDIENDVVLGEVLLLSESPLNPVVHTDYQPWALNATIPENTVYTFSRESTGTYSPSSLKEDIFYLPNPARDVLTLKADPSVEIITPICIYNLSGLLMKCADDHAHFELTGLQSGIYELRFRTALGWHAQRIVVLPD